jgi:hypothetical protein
MGSEPPAAPATLAVLASDASAILAGAFARHRRAARTAAGRAERERIAAEHALTPKRDRPKCGARTRAGGECDAPAVWDRLANRPRNGRCRLHGGAVARDEDRHDDRRRHRGRLA